MRRISILFTAVIMFASCAKESIRGSGATITETRNVAAFTDVRAEGSSNVEIIMGTQQKVEVTGYENLVPIYETYVINGTLVVKFRNDYFNIRNSNIRVRIEVPQLSSTSLNGSGEITIRDFVGSNLSVTINGSGNIYSSNCSYNYLYAKVNGSGHLRATNIYTNTSEAEISGSGTIDVTASQKLKARISGSGEISYYGNPVTTDIQVSGSGHVRKK